jgi:hypothetical protein
VNPVFLFRLVLDGIAVGLLLFAYAYFWQGNASHELVGIALFLMVLVHNVFHRRWFAALVKGTRASPGKFNIAVTLVLITTMLTLLVSSLVISETLFADFRLADDFSARQFHASIAYWLLLVVAIHLGLRWPMLMAIARKQFGIVKPNLARTTALRLVAIGLAVQGTSSMLALNLDDRLLFQMSLDWWNFEESVAGFFGHCLAVVGLFMFVTYYAMQWHRRSEPKVSA